MGLGRLLEWHLDIAFTAHLRAIRQTGKNVLTFKLRVFGQNIRDRQALRQQVKNEGYPYPVPFNAWLAEADVGIYRNTIKVLLLHRERVSRSVATFKDYPCLHLAKPFPPQDFLVRGILGSKRSRATPEPSCPTIVPTVTRLPLQSLGDRALGHLQRLQEAVERLRLHPGERQPVQRPHALRQGKRRGGGYAQGDKGLLEVSHRTKARRDKGTKGGFNYDCALRSLRSGGGIL
jgi:hypothetical protein